MALSKKSVEVAINVFHQIDTALWPGICKFDENDYTKGMIYGAGVKSDGGYEGLCIHIDTSSVDKHQLFEALKCQVGNTAFIRESPDGLVSRIGFY